MCFVGGGGKDWAESLRMMASAASLVAAVVAVAVVALATVAREMLRRAAARREEVRWLARLAGEELEAVEREAYYYCQQGAFMRAADVPEAPPLWVAPGVPLPRIEEEEATAPTVAAVAAAGKGLCAVCRRSTSFRCKRCKGVKYCTFKCQIVHWRKGHKDECHPPSAGDRKDNTIEASCAMIGVECSDSYEEILVAGVEPAVKINSPIAASPESSEVNRVAKSLNGESKNMPFEKISSTAEASDHDNNRLRVCRVAEQAESADCSSFLTSSKACIVQGTSVRENGSQPQIPAGNSSSQADWSAGLESELEQPSKQAPCIENIESSRSLPPMSTGDKVPTTCGAHFSAASPSKKIDNVHEIIVRSENEGVVLNNLSMAKNIVIRQQTAPKVARHYPSELTLFPYGLFVNLYNFNKLELRPFGLCNLGNSCYANAVLQCLAFTRPLTAYLLEGLHSQNCSQKEWCFLCEFEKLIAEGKQGKSLLSPTGILSHLCDIGSGFGPGKEEDAHEFLRYAIDTMQSASIKEAKKNGVHKLPEETTLMQLIFGGYLRSKIKCTKCQVSSEHCERILDLTVEIDGDISTLEEALCRFTSTEMLDGDNKYYCSRCKSYERAKKKLRISEAPNILTIALKRYQTGMFGKINKAIRFPEYLNLSSYMGTMDDHSPVYRLYAVVVHQDVLNSAFSGHYVCYVNNSQGQWHEMDDSQVKPVSLENVLSKSAYMLLYARCSPRAPSFLRKALIAQRKGRQTVDPGPTGPGGVSYLSRHQGGPLCRDHVVYDRTYTLDTSGDSSYPVADSTSPRDSSSLFTNSDVGSASTFSSDSSDGTTKSTSMEEYDYIFGSSDQMYPVSTVVIPEEHELSYSRQRSSLNPSSSNKYTDQAGQIERQHQLEHQSSRGTWDEGWAGVGESPSLFYTDQGKHQGSSSRRRRSGSCSGSGSSKLTEQHRRRMAGEADHGPAEGKGGILAR